MPLETAGAVLLVEVRVAPRTRLADPGAIDERLAEARVLLENAAENGEWTRASGPGVSGTLVLADPAEAFPLLHRVRTELRSDPGRPAVAVASGIGRGDEMEASRLAGQAFRSLARKRDLFTRALTSDPDTNTVLGALCRTLDSLHSGWTRAQWQAVHRRDRGRTLQEIGQELGIAYQNVSKRLIAARYSLYGEVLDAASLVFSKAPPSTP
jgi:hypothetical protein